MKELAAAAAFALFCLASAESREDRSAGSSGADRIAPVARFGLAGKSAAARWLASAGPAGFESNVGQFDKRADFMARGSRSTIYLTGGNAVLSLTDSTAPSGSSSTVIGMELTRRHGQVRAEPLDPQASIVNDYRGNDSRGWHPRIPIYSRVKYAGVYPGIDLIYYFDGRGQLEYDLVVAPGADPASVRLRFHGIRLARTDRDGNLLLKTPGGELAMRRPVIYQLGHDGRRSVQGRFVTKGKREVGFALDAYDRGRPLWIDPAFEYSTYLGGTSNETGSAIAVDAAGNAYVTGSTLSTNFPTLAALQPVMAGSSDAFVAKLDPAGVLQYSTYLGGFSRDEARGIAVDAHGTVYVTGSALTQFGITGFPTTPGAFQRVGAFDDVFVTRLDPSGGLSASTLLGGADDDDGLSIAIDAAGYPYVTGTTRSHDFPTAAPLQPANRGQVDAFVAKLNPELTRLEYS